MLAIGTSQVLCRPLDEQNMFTKHEEWMAQHGRIYKDMDEKERRYMIFEKNVEWIEAFNKGLDQKYTLNIWECDDVPPSIDGRQKGAVTPIKDRGSCGCCWALSAVATMEGINQLKTGNLTSLFEQELVDCDTKDQGCEGGLMDNAFQFVLHNSRLTTEANYPYKGVGGTCNPKKTTNHSATITGYEV
nr:senescence-specific cysteine protease sag39 [Quercus suber]